MRSRIREASVVHLSAMVRSTAPIQPFPVPARPSRQMWTSIRAHPYRNRGCPPRLTRPWPSAQSPPFPTTFRNSSGPPVRAGNPVLDNRTRV